MHLILERFNERKLVRWGLLLLLGLAVQATAVAGQHDPSTDLQAQISMLTSPSSLDGVTVPAISPLRQEPKCTFGDISGCSRPVRAGLFIGGVGGVVVGAAIGYGTFDENAEPSCTTFGGCSEPLGRGERTLAGATLGGLLGASVGVIIGSLVDSPGEVQVTPTGSGGVNMRLSFAM